MKAIAFVLAVGITSMAFAQAKSEAVDEYRGVTSGGMYLCNLQIELAIVKKGADAGNDPAGCIAEQQAAAKAAYRKALSTVKKPAAQRLLKDYQANWSAAMRDLLPRRDELVVDYKRRRGDQVKQLDQQWERFDLER